MIPEGVRESHLRDTLDYAIGADGRETRKTYTYGKGDRLRRTLTERTDRRPRFRYHLKIGGAWIRVPWLAWAMFS